MDFMKPLDESVFADYGWKSDLSDQEILAKLLALNLERSQGRVIAQDGWMFPLYFLTDSLVIP